VIGKLSGRVDAIEDGTVLIDVGGVGYLATCSGRTQARLNVGEAASLLIETVVREDAIQLYGFADISERTLFRLLTTVQGVGPKAALAILGVVATDDLVTAIAAGDRSPLTRAPGVGPKLAQRIVAELADRIGRIGAGAGAGPVVPTAAGPVEGNAARDAVSALVNLGFRPADALSAVGRVAARLGGEAGVEALVRGGLAELAPKEQPA
jgi:Holliday junction DNA helicase, RuvA subunit